MSGRNQEKYPPENYHQNTYHTRFREQVIGVRHPAALTRIQTIRLGDGTSVAQSSLKAMELENLFDDAGVPVDTAGKEQGHVHTHANAHTTGAATGDVNAAAASGMSLGGDSDGKPAEPAAEEQNLLELGENGDWVWNGDGDGDGDVVMDGESLEGLLSTVAALQGQVGMQPDGDVVMDGESLKGLFSTLEALQGQVDILKGVSLMKLPQRAQPRLLIRRVPSIKINVGVIMIDGVRRFVWQEAKPELEAPRSTLS